MPKDYCDGFRGDWESRKNKLTFFARCFGNCNSVVDLGCGRGELLSLLEESDIKALGVDGDLDQINRCRDAGFDVTHEDIFTFLESDRKFDGIMISHVIEHLDGNAAEKLLTRSYEMLNPGGKVIIITPNSDNLAVMTNIFWLDVTHVRPYPIQLLTAMCIDAGLEIVSSGEDNMSAKPGWKLQIRRNVIGPVLRLVGMGQLSNNLFSSTDIFVVAQKPPDSKITKSEGAD